MTPNYAYAAPVIPNPPFTEVGISLTVPKLIKPYKLSQQTFEKLAVIAESAPKAAPAPSTSFSGGDAKLFIYMKESGNNPGAIAPNGACGLGQALPCSKMPCSLSDYACQDAFFTDYMLQRYGSWESAQAFWLGHLWW